MRTAGDKTSAALETWHRGEARKRWRSWLGGIEAIEQGHPNPWLREFSTHLGEPAASTIRRAINNELPPDASHHDIQYWLYWLAQWQGWDASYEYSVKTGHRNRISIDVLVSEPLNERPRYVLEVKKSIPSASVLDIAVAQALRYAGVLAEASGVDDFDTIVISPTIKPSVAGCAVPVMTPGEFWTLITSRGFLDLDLHWAAAS